MKRTILKGTVAFLALMTASGALANDYNSGVVTKAPSEVFTDVEFGSNWYIRGDIAYNIDGREDRGISQLTLPDGTLASIQGDYDDAIAVRVGFGNYVAPNIRLEATVEGLFNSEFAGTGAQSYAGSRTTTGTPAVTVDFNSVGLITSSSDPLLVGTTTAPISGTSTTTADYASTNLLLSGYLDLPSFGSITPYVGAGVGVARVSFSQTTTFTCTAAATETCAFPAGAQGATAEISLRQDEDFWGLAYQLSVGAAIALDERLMLDLGYSYTDIDSGDTINYSDGTAVEPDGFAVHQVRAGLRYNIF